MSPEELLEIIRGWNRSDSPCFRGQKKPRREKRPGVIYGAKAEKRTSYNFGRPSQMRDGNTMLLQKICLPRQTGLSSNRFGLCKHR